MCVFSNINYTVKTNLTKKRVDPTNTKFLFYLVPNVYKKFGSKKINVTNTL